MVANPKHIDNIVTALKGVPTEVVPGLSRVMGDGKVANGLAEAMTEGPDSLAKFLDNVEGGSDLLKNPAFVRISEQLHDAEVAATAASRASREAAQAAAPQPVNATTDPAVIAVQARRTMDGMIRNMDPSVALNKLDDAGMQGFADDFIRRMKEVNPEFDGLHRLDEKAIQAINVRMTDAMGATGNTTNATSDFFGRFQNAVNSRFTPPNANSAQVADGMQVAVRNGEPINDSTRLTGDAQGRLSTDGPNNLPANRQNTDLDTIADEATTTPPHNRNGGGGDEPPVNNGDNLGDNAFRGAAGRLPQELMDQAGDIRVALKNGNWFGENAVAKADKLVEGLRANRGANAPIAEGATTPREILDAIENGYQPSSQQITDLKGALDQIAVGRTTRSWSAPQLPNPFPTRQSGIEPFSTHQIGRVMDGLDPNPIANSFIGRNSRSLAFGTILTTSLTGMVLPEDSSIGAPGRWINGTIGGIKIPYTEDRIGVNLYQAPMMFSGVFVDSALDYLENSADAGEFHRLAVAGVAADKVGQGNDPDLKPLDDPRSVTLYALRTEKNTGSLDNAQLARLQKIEQSIDGPIMEKVLLAEANVAANLEKGGAALAEQDIDQTNKDFVNERFDESSFSIQIDGTSVSSAQASYGSFAEFYGKTFSGSTPSMDLQQQWKAVEAAGDGISGLSQQEMTTLQAQLKSGTEKVILGEFKLDFK